MSPINTIPTREEVQKARADALALYQEIRLYEERIKDLRQKAREIHSLVLERVPVPGWVRMDHKEKCGKCGRVTEWCFYDSDGQGGPLCHWQCVISARTKFDRELDAYLTITGFHDDDDDDDDTNENEEPQK